MGKNGKIKEKERLFFLILNQKLHIKALGEAEFNTHTFNESELGCWYRCMLLESQFTLNSQNK